MELALWLWAYDERWLFSLPTPKSLWLLAFIFDLLICGPLLYGTITIYDSPCGGDILKDFLISRSALSCFSLLCFLGLTYHSWVLHHEEGHVQYKSYDFRMKGHSLDYWYRHETLTSFWGWLAFVCGLASLCWTFYSWSVSANVVDQYRTCQSVPSIISLAVLAFFSFSALPIVTGVSLIFGKLISIGILAACPALSFKVKRPAMKHVLLQEHK
eukprot:GILI01011699.1.p1 GENE.GILI01011699.1~~GILI01011699.1.p1  ORF type:complete len:235 (+),score=22.50 GILI01011699.1:64-705(+)